ncbi:MAG: hypothetical protein ACM3XN_05870 [Chloroflexota bacterium]
MNKQELIDLGEQLRGIGHRRRELAERVFAEAADGDTADSKQLYQELASVTDQAITLMKRQKDILESEVRKLH